MKIDQMTDGFTGIDQEATVRCPKCGQKIGYYEPRHGTVWLKIGHLSVRVLRSYCECGFEFDFDVSTKRLEELIKRIKEL